MTKEEEKAIERLKNYKEYILKCGNKKSKHFKAVVTVLNMLKEKDEKIAKYEKIYKEYDCYRWVKELEKKDKIIDLMAKSFAEEGFYSEHCQTLIDNEICPNDCDKCVKQYFERKVKRWKLK